MFKILFYGGQIFSFNYIYIYIHTHFIASGLQVELPMRAKSMVSHTSLQHDSIAEANSINDLMILLVYLDTVILYEFKTSEDQLF